MSTQDTYAVEDDGTIVATASAISLLTSAEIDQQIVTAHKYPRSVTRFRANVADMVKLSEQIAGECIYSVPRDGKTIQGASVRFAEIILNSWGNNRAGARVVSDVGEFVTAQGVYYDLEANSAIAYEVQRRIVDKKGRRFSSDMIGITSNAACSIALRNAILKGIPKAYWAPMFELAKKVALGDIQTLPNRRAEAFTAFQAYGVTPAMIFAQLNVDGRDDIGQEQLLFLVTLLTAIKEGDTTPEEAFAGKPTLVPSTSSVAMPQEKPQAAPAAAAPVAAAPVAAAPVAAANDAEPLATAPAPAPAPPAQAAVAGDSPLVSDSKLRLLKARMGAHGLAEPNLQARFGVAFAGVTVALYPEIAAWAETGDSDA